MASVVDTGHEPAVLDAYPLASLQSAMLVNHLQAPRSGVDIVQMVSEMSEEIDVPALTAAWERVSERHAALRTAFRWENTELPLQEVFGSVPPEVRVLDWSGQTGERSDAALREFLREDRVAGVTWAVRLHHSASWQIEAYRRGDCVCQRVQTQYPGAGWQQCRHCL